MVEEKLYFITGNKGKFEHAKTILPEIEQIDFDLPEIQELDPKKVIEEKLKEATKISDGRFFCEDVSLCINCLNGLPGTLIKPFLGALGLKGISNLVSKFEDRGAVAKVLVGYSDGDGVIFFEESMEGEIVEPRGDGGYGWDSLFVPKGYDKTFAEMDADEYKAAMMKTKVFLKLKEYIDSNEK